MLTVYGIKQCDTCRKALAWLVQQGIEHRFHDLRGDGLEVHLLQTWLDSDFSDRLINRRSTTWRQLNEAQRRSEGVAMLQLLLQFPTLIKRPVFVTDQVIAVGFNRKELADLKNE